MLCRCSASSAVARPISTRSSGLMKPSLTRNPPARTTASRSGIAQWCSISSSAAAESLGISSRTSHASASENAWTPLPAAASPAAGARLEPFLALDAEADQRADDAAELLRLVAAEVAQVLDLELPGGVLVDGERVDDAHGVALAQAFQLGDDLAPEVRVIEAEHYELDRSDGHVGSFGWVTGRSEPRLDRTRPDAAAAESAS